MTAVEPKRVNVNLKRAAEPQKMTVQQPVSSQKPTLKTQGQSPAKAAQGGPSGSMPQGKPPAPRPATEAGGLEFLLSMEGRVRETKNEIELIHFAANETRKLTVHARYFYSRACRVAT